MLLLSNARVIVSATFEVGSIEWANHVLEIEEDCREALAKWIFDYMVKHNATLNQALNQKIDEGFKGKYSTVHRWVSNLPEYQERRAWKAANPSSDAKRMRKIYEAKSNKKQRLQSLAAFKKAELKRQMENYVQHPSKFMSSVVAGAMREYEIAYWDYMNCND